MDHALTSAEAGNTQEEEQTEGLLAGDFDRVPDMEEDKGVSSWKGKDSSYFGAWDSRRLLFDLHSICSPRDLSWNVSFLLPPE